MIYFCGATEVSKYIGVTKKELKKVYRVELFEFDHLDKS